MSRHVDEDPSEIRRILVALDASSHSLAALEAAVKLAAFLRAEVTGLFVEDISLLDVADLPITHEVGTFSGQAREFNRRDVERQLRAQALAAERALALTASRAHVSWTFRVARGAVSAEVLAAAAEADLVSVGSHGSRLAGWRHVGSTAHAVLSDTRCPVMVMRHGEQLEPPVVVVFDGSKASHRALIVAAMLAHAMTDEVVVITADDGSGSIERLVQAARESLADEDLDLHFHRFSPGNPVAIAGVARDAGCGVLVLPAGAEWLTLETLQALSRAVHCPVLLARECEAGARAGDAATPAPAEDEPEARTA
jgi:nucleotide-binding universal stress UspA family protein